MRRHHLFPFALALAGLSLLVTGCPRGKSEDPWGSAGNRPKVLVSFAPLYSFAAAVAGPDAEVKCLLTTTGPHTEGDISTHQIELARGCTVFVINGLGLENGADGIATKLEKRAGNPNWNVLNLGSKLDPDWLMEGECDHGHDQGPGHKHEHPTDPHVWLSVRCAKKMVEGIRDELKRLDPDHAQGYDGRAADYLRRLDRLEQQGKSMLAGKKEKRILSFHESLNYFAETYGLEVAGVIEVTPGQEPSDRKLKQIIETCANPREPVRVIAVEPQFSTHTSARVIRDALHGKSIEAEFAEVNPLETSPEADLGPDLYETVMRKNLAELARVLR